MELLDGFDDGAADRGDWARTGTVVDPRDLRQALLDLLAEGSRHATFRLRAAEGAPHEVLIERTGPGSGTALTVRFAEGGVHAELFDADGKSITRGQSIVHLRGLPAGDYWLKVYTGPLTDALAFALEVTPPGAGQTGAIYADPDRDKLYGGDDNDVLASNENLGSMYGHSGANFFVGGNWEIRDFRELEGDHRATLGRYTDQLQKQFAQADPFVRVSDPNVGAGIARE